MTDLGFPDPRSVFLWLHFAFWSRSLAHSRQGIFIQTKTVAKKYLINDRNEANVVTASGSISATVPDAKLLLLPFDLSSTAGQKGLTTTFPSIDILINNIVIFEVMSYEQIDDITWLPRVKFNRK
ncbi:hypothetical protein JCM31185_06300 [Furfurilactobacillus curtus]|uniref:Uncharacterized protein n=1 Tax=Furfurilactobacillus curtus TaxID=1746200 RepID=A0ABQ5JLT9_9LACO